MSLSLLLVEDNARTRDQILAMLSRSAYKVTVANNGLDGLGKAKNQCFDAVLMDHQMPLMDGIKLVKNLRDDAEYKETPLLLMTTTDPDSIDERATQAGADIVLAKPLDERHLLRKLRDLLPRVVA